MNPGSITMLFCRKEKVLTIVGAFFVAQNTVSVLIRNHCPLYTGILQISVYVNVSRHLLLRITPSKGVSILRIRKSGLKLKNEIKNLHGFNWKTGALRTTLIKQYRRPGSKNPIWW